MNDMGMFGRWVFAAIIIREYSCCIYVCRLSACKLAYARTHIYSQVGLHVYRTFLHSPGHDCIIFNNPLLSLWIHDYFRFSLKVAYMSKLSCSTIWPLLNQDEDSPHLHPALLLHPAGNLHQTSTSAHCSYCCWWLGETNFVFCFLFICLI